MKAAEWIATVPWCMTAEALEAMVSIAERTPLPDAAERIHGPKALAMRAGTRRDDSARMEMRDGVALIHIDGPIYRYADFFTAVSGGVTTEALARDLQAALDDPRVDAVLFVIDSPGGEATGIGELAQAIYGARGAKPLGAYIEGYGASAAYWIASAADHIWIDPSALAGSIGTVMSVWNPEAMPKPARRLEFVSSQSPKKRVDPTSQAGREYLQQITDDMTEVFIAAVMRNRGMSREAVLAVEGGMRVGRLAVEAGLADALGAEEEAIAALAAQGRERRAPGYAWSAHTLEDHMASTTERRGFWRDFWGGAQDAGVIASDAEAPPAEQAATPPPADPELATLREQIAAQAAEVAALRTERERLANEARAARLAKLAEGWPGATADHLAVLDVLGEDTPAAAAYARTMTAVTEQARTGELFARVGSDEPPPPADAWAEIARRAETIAAADGITIAAAVARVAETDPALYARYRAERS